MENGNRLSVTFENEDDALEEGGGGSSSSSEGMITPIGSGGGAGGGGGGSSINKALSVVSKQYDHNSKGYLDETEQRMRELDRSGKGHLSNAVVYDLMKDSMEVQKKMVTQRWLLIGLTCFSVILALSNMATGFAAASLAKDTEVATTTNNLVVKGHPDQLVGTAAKSEQFTFGTVAEGADERRRRLEAFEVSFFGAGDFEYAGHTTLSAVDAQALWQAHLTGAVKLRWTCGAIGQGRQFVKQVQDGSMTPYSNSTTGDGTLYSFDVLKREGNPFNPLPTVSSNPNAQASTEGGAGSTAQMSGMTLPSLYQQIYIDCPDGASVCTVANTNCCILTFDEMTGTGTDDCPGETTCAACGCMCIEPGTPEFRCWSGCELTEPYSGALINW